MLKKPSNTSSKMNSSTNIKCDKCEEKKDKRELKESE